MTWQDRPENAGGCPNCGSVRRRSRTTGMDSVGRRMRYVICSDCGTYYSTVEVTMPISLYVLDAARKYRNRMLMRSRRGYHGTKGGQPLKPEPVLDVTVKVRAP